MSDNQKPDMQNAADNGGQNAGSQNQEQYQHGTQQGAAPNPYPPQQQQAPYPNNAQHGYAEQQQNMYQHQHGQQGNHQGQGGQGGYNHQAPVYPYQAQHQPMPPVAPPPPQYPNPYYDPYMGQYPHPHYNNAPAPAPESGLSSFFNFRDERFLKGALVGAAATFLLTNDSVQKNAIGSIVKVWNLFQGGFEEVKERFRDAEAEIKTQDQ